MKLMLKRTDCNLCGVYMIPDRLGFYTCPGCGAQWVPPSDSARERKKVILACARNEHVSEGLIHVKGISSGSKSKNYTDKKQKMQRPSQKQLYDRLANRENDKPYKIL